MGHLCSTNSILYPPIRKDGYETANTHPACFIGEFHYWHAFLFISNCLKSHSISLDEGCGQPHLIDRLTYCSRLHFPHHPYISFSQSPPPFLIFACIHHICPPLYCSISFIFPSPHSFDSVTHAYSRLSLACSGLDKGVIDHVLTSKITVGLDMCMFLLTKSQRNLLRCVLYFCSDHISFFSGRCSYK